MMTRLLGDVISGKGGKKIRLGEQMEMRGEFIFSPRREEKRDEERA